MRKYAVLLIALLALCACELFEVRDSEPPTKPPSWNNFTTSWELCLQNLSYCYEDARNVVKYGGLFTEGFRFSFAPQDINDYGISGIWGRAQEQDMLLSLHGQCDSLQLDLQPISGQNDDISASEAIIYRSYELSLLKRTERPRNPIPAIWNCAFAKTEAIGI
jgi:hypothetical protein